MAIGSALMTQVYANGPTSGAHLNPAVTLGVLLRNLFDGDSKSLSVAKAAKYAFVQVAAAFTAGFVALFVIAGVIGINRDSGLGIGAPYPHKEIPAALLAEVIGTFILVLVVLNVATAERTKNNSFFGLAIGYTVQAMAFTFGDVSGGCFNPAVGLLRLVNFLSAANSPCKRIWIFWVAPFAGAIAATIVFKMQGSGKLSDEQKAKMAEDQLIAHRAQKLSSNEV